MGKRTLGAASGRFQQLAASAARDPDAPIANGWLIFYLALLVAVLVFVVGGVFQWHNGSAQGNIVVGVLWRLTWVTFTVLKTVLIVLLLIWGYRWFVRRNAKRSD